MQHTKEEWEAILGPNAYAVMREVRTTGVAGLFSVISTMRTCCHTKNLQAATERRFSSPLYGEHRRGTYVCAGCEAPLFTSAMKYESGTGEG